MSQEEAKRAAGEAAAQLVEDGMRLGLGTGSTTAHALRFIGERIRREELDVAGVPTSPAAALLAREVGIPLITLEDETHLDLALDGADEVDPMLRLIKGRGAAHTREHIVTAQAERFVVLVDSSKEVERLGTQAPVPIEIVPMARVPVAQAVERMGARPTLRKGQRKDGPVVTDQGLWVIDAHFEKGIDDPEALAERIRMLPGVLDHGLFLREAESALVGQSDGSVERRKRAPASAKSAC